MVEHRFRKAVPHSRKSRKNKDLQPASPDLSAPLQRAAKQALPVADLPPDLTQVAASWESLPEAVKAGILAMVTASRGQ